MTIETRCFAPIDDAEMIEIACSKPECDGVLYLRPKPGSVRAEQSCQNCGAGWWRSPDNLDTPVYRLITALIACRNDPNRDHPNATIVFPAPEKN